MNTSEQNRQLLFLFIISYNSNDIHIVISLFSFALTDGDV